MANKDKENSIVPTETANLAEMHALMEEFGGGALDSLTPQDVVMPRYRLIQNTSRTGTPGKWVSNIDSDLELDELNIVILDISSYRVMFPKPGEGDRPLCRSNDGVTKASPDGVGDSSCGSCRYAQWGKDTTTGRPIKPPCSSGYTLLGIILLPDGTTSPGMVSLKGTAIKPLKQFFTAMKSRNLPSFAYVTNIKSVSDVNEMGRFYKPVFNFGDDLPLAVVKDFAMQARTFKQYISRDVMADVDAGEGESAGFSGKHFMEDLEGASVVGDTEIAF